MKQQDKELLDKAVNPFTIQNFVDVREISNTSKVVNVNNIREGIITEKPFEIKSTYFVEDSNSCKLYTRLGFRLHISELSDNAKSLFLWLMYDLGSGEDHIELDVKRVNRYKIETRKSTVAYTNSLKELIRASIVSHTGIGKIYWINPIFFFNGSRIKKYPDKLIERT